MEVIMSIADAILTQIRQAGQPRTIRATETITGKEPIDIGGLGLLLYMLMQMQQPGAKLGTTPLPGARTFGGADVLGQAPASFGPSASPVAQGFGGMDPSQLMAAILSAGGGGF